MTEKDLIELRAAAPEYRCEPTARVIADSVNERGERLTTMALTYWRPLLPQLNTHRAFSRNSQSNRATKIRALIEAMCKTVWGPYEFHRDGRGMDGGEALPPDVQAECRRRWIESARAAMQTAWTLADMGASKQEVNRLLEPYSCVRTLVTAARWGNFYRLRLDAHAQPDMRRLAEVMRAAMDNSRPALVRDHAWHLPYITSADRKAAVDAFPHDLRAIEARLVAVSVARSARVSSGEGDKPSDLVRDLKLYKRLVDNGHWSPLEHAAQARETARGGARNFGDVSWVQWRALTDGGAGEM